MSVIAFVAQMAGVQNMPRWFIGVVGIVAWVAIAVFCIWREDKKKLAIALKTIRDADQTAAIQNAISAFILKGNDLNFKGRQNADQAFIHECNQWGKEAEDYLRAAINELAGTAFRHPDHDYFDSTIANEIARRICAQNKALKAIALDIAAFVKPLSSTSDKSASAD